MVQYFATQIQTPLQTSLGAGKLRAQQDISALRQQQLQQAQQQQAQNQQLMGLRQQALGGQQGALGRMAAIDPQAALQVQKFQQAQTQAPSLIGGTGLDVQAANNQALMYKQQGLSDQEARRRGISDVYQTQVQRDELGNVIRRQPLPNVTPETVVSAQDVILASPQDRPRIYKEVYQQAVNRGEDVSGLPEEYTEQLDMPFAIIASQEPTAPSLVRPEARDILSTAARAARAKEGAKAGVQQKTVIEDEALASADQIEDFQQVYDIYDRGFKGSLLAGFDFRKIELKRAAGQSLTPEEQQFASDYSQLKSIADVNVAKSIKPIFGGNISDGEREFALKLQAQPMNIAEQAIAKAAVQEAGALQKIRKNEMADAWINEYGALEAKDRSGRSFQGYYSKYAKNNPIMSVAFLAERGVIFPITGTPRKQRELFDSLPVGAKYINPKDKIIYRKTN